MKSHQLTIQRPKWSVSSSGRKWNLQQKVATRRIPLITWPGVPKPDPSSKYWRNQGESKKASIWSFHQNKLINNCFHIAISDFKICISQVKRHLQKVAKIPSKAERSIFNQRTKIKKTQSLDTKWSYKTRRKTSQSKVEECWRGITIAPTRYWMCKIVPRILRYQKSILISSRGTWLPSISPRRIRRHCNIISIQADLVLDEMEKFKIEEKISKK